MISKFLSNLNIFVGGTEQLSNVDPTAVQVSQQLVYAFYFIDVQHNDAKVKYLKQAFM